MSKSERVFISLKVRPDLKDRVQSIVDRDDTSINHEVNRLLRGALDAEEKLAERFDPAPPIADAIPALELASMLEHGMPKGVNRKLYTKVLIGLINWLAGMPMPEVENEEHCDYLYRLAFIQALGNGPLREHIFMAGMTETPRDLLNQKHAEWANDVNEAGLNHIEPFARRVAEIDSSGKLRAEFDDVSQWQDLVLKNEDGSRLATAFMKLQIEEQQLGWAEIEPLPLSINGWQSTGLSLLTLRMRTRADRETREPS